MALPTLRAGSSGETGGGFPKPSGVTAGNTFNLTIRSGFRAAFFLGIGPQTDCASGKLCRYLRAKIFKMGMMNKNTVLGWATLIMILMGLLLIGLGIFRYDDVAGWGFGAVGVGFLANAWVFSSLKGRV
jgi:hypothetical protein